MGLPSLRLRRSSALIEARSLVPCRGAKQQQRSKCAGRRSELRFAGAPPAAPRRRAPPAPRACGYAPASPSSRSAHARQQPALRPAGADRRVARTMVQGQEEGGAGEQKHRRPPAKASARRRRRRPSLRRRRRSWRRARSSRKRGRPTGRGSSGRRPARRRRSTPRADDPRGGAAHPRRGGLAAGAGARPDAAHRLRVGRAAAAAAVDFPGRTTRRRTAGGAFARQCAPQWPPDCPRGTYYPTGEGAVALSLDAVSTCPSAGSSPRRGSGVGGRRPREQGEHRHRQDLVEAVPRPALPARCRAPIGSTPGCARGSSRCCRQARASNSRRAQFGAQFRRPCSRCGSRSTPRRSRRRDAGAATPSSLGTTPAG